MHLCAKHAQSSCIVTVDVKVSSANLLRDENLYVLLFTVASQRARFPPEVIDHSVVKSNLDSLALLFVSCLFAINIAIDSVRYVIMPGLCAQFAECLIASMGNFNGWLTGCGHLTSDIAP